MGNREYPYGFCPKCSLPGVSRERRLNGNDRCQRGHVYQSSKALKSQDDWGNQFVNQEEESHEIP